MHDLQAVEILLVEDSETDGEMTLRALKQKALANAVTWVRDGAEALDYLFCTGVYEGRGNGFPKLIPLDLKMPKLDGIEVLRVVKADERTNMIPVVMLTSSAEERDIVQSYKLGVNSYLVKPVGLQQFLEEVSKAGCYWAVVNKVPRVI